MGIAFDYAADRPEHVDQILNGLDRYNPETTTVFQDYVVQQCENQTYDCYANLALLKLYQFNPHLSRDDTIISILAKSLTVSPSPDFGLCLHLLAPSVLHPPRNTSIPLAAAVAKLNELNNALSSASYAHFWALLHAPAGSSTSASASADGSEAYAELVADVAGFDELMRVRIAATVSQSVREVQRPVLEGWLDLRAAAFERFVGEVCGWEVDGDVVRVPLNKENHAKGTVVRENVKFEQFGRVVRRAYEQPA